MGLLPLVTVMQDTKVVCQSHSDTNGITRHPVREDIEVYAIDATAECARMGQAKLFNTMILRIEVVIEKTYFIC